MKLYIKIWAVLFIFSATPVLIIQLFQSLQVEDQSKILTGKEASPILFSATVEKKMPSPYIDRYIKVGKIIYLTFDDGPNGNTFAILNALKSRNVKATFFLLKENIDKNPDVLKEIVASGNAVGCHGVSHRVDIFYSSVTTAINEMKLCQRTIYDITKIKSPLIRVPFGSYPHLTHEIRDGLIAAGFIYWDWNVDSEDWTIEDGQRVLANIKTQLQFVEERGKIPTVLLHDKKVTASILPQLLDDLQAKGYQFIPLNSNMDPVQFNRFEKPAP